MKWIKDKLTMLAGVALIVAFLLLVGGCVRWKWSECRGVGHGVAYCVLEMGRK